jgi:hypothetical protein
VLEEHRIAGLAGECCTVVDRYCIEVEVVDILVATVAGSHIVVAHNLQESGLIIRLKLSKNDNTPRCPFICPGWPPLLSSLNMLSILEKKDIIAEVWKNEKSKTGRIECDLEKRLEWVREGKIIE